MDSSDASVFYDNPASKAQAPVVKPSTAAPADAFYGTPNPAPATPAPAAPQAPAPQPTAAQPSAADSLYDNTKKDQAPGDQPAAAAQDPAGVPEAYEFQVPEGLVLNETALAEFTPLAKELNLNQTQAQKLVDLYGARLQADTAAQVQGWEAAIKADVEIGGEAFERSVSAAKRVLTYFGTPALIADLNRTGMGSNPEVVRLLARVGRALNGGR